VPSETILVLGGTREAAELADRLVAARPDARIVTSLAGRTRDPAAIAGEVRSGGFGGANGLAAWMRENAVTTLIDASHPFATAISANAARAAEIASVPRLRLVRPAWTAEAGDLWKPVPTLDAAAAALPSGAVALLALGRQHLAPFAARTDCRFVVRSVDAPQPPLPFAAGLLLGKPSTDPDEEAALFQRLDVSHLVCRNSGGAGAHAKIVAARRLALPVVMIERPPLPEGAVHGTVEQVLAAIGIPDDERKGP
jgi:Precorrin-6x reductase